MGWKGWAELLAWGVWIGAIPLCSSCTSAKCLSFFSFKLPVHFHSSL